MTLILRILHILPLLALFGLLAPVSAQAWGVGVHLQVGSHILNHLSLLPPALAALLSLWRDDFLYGCISADITLGKKFTHHLEHCHGWRIGEKVLAAADSDSRRAFAWGYLSHLAADTVAHGYFVPFKTARSYNSMLLQHTYWEMRMEAQVEPEIWQLGYQVARRSYLDNDQLLRSVLSDTIFSFATNKRLFNSMLLLQRLQQWQRTLHLLEHRSRWTIGTEEREEYLSLCREAAVSILVEGEASPWRMADPTGERALRAAGAIRRNLRHLWQEGKVDEATARLYLEQLRHSLRRGLTQPDTLLDLLVTEDRSYPREVRRRTIRSSSR